MMIIFYKIHKHINADTVILWTHISDRVQPKKSIFSTHDLILWHQKVENHFSKPIFIKFDIEIDSDKF